MALKNKHKINNSRPVLQLSNYLKTVLLHLLLVIMQNG